MKKNILFFLTLLLVFSCQKEDKPIVSFYYWKTIFQLSQQEKEAISTNEVKKIYVRYFDVTLDQSNLPMPVSPIHFQDKISGINIVPVIYIKNNVLLNKQINITNLSENILKLIHQINVKNKITISEIQIDCDWTLNSKENYLKFIDVFKKSSQKTLSATIRLHQIKYFERTKIPNVDYGVLMYYNMGKIAPDSLNSIYDEAIANKYLSHLKKYPLPFNIALPIYSWAVHIQDGKVIGLRNKIDIENLKKDTNFVSTKNHFYKVKNNNYKGGIFYKKNDLLKIESISKEDLAEMATDLKENLKQNPKEIIFYDLDEFNIKNYEKNTFEKIINQF